MYDFNSLSLKELQELAKRYEVEGVSTRTPKAQLVEAIEAAGVAEKMEAVGETIVNGDVVIPAKKDDVIAEEIPAVEKVSIKVDSEADEETLTIKINVDVLSEAIMQARVHNLSLEDFVVKVIESAVIPKDIIRAPKWKAKLRTHRKPKEKYIMIPSGFVPGVVAKKK